MADIEYVNGDAYVSSRNLKEYIICDFCGNETRTHIRVPSLNTYLWWCETCQKVPSDGWSILTPETAFYNLPENQMPYRFIVSRGLKHYKKFGLSYQKSFRLAIDDLRCIIKRRKLHDIIDDNRNKENEYDYIKTVLIDINTVIKKLVANLNDSQRKVLALSIEKHKLDELLTEDNRTTLFDGIDTQGIQSYSRTEQLEFLGLDYSTSGNYYRRKKEIAIEGKRILDECGFGHLVRK